MRNNYLTIHGYLKAGKREPEGRIPNSLGQKPFRAAQNAFHSEAGHFFLKVHDPFKPSATIVELGRVHGKRLGERSDLQCDQIIDLAPEGKESLLSHRLTVLVSRVLSARALALTLCICVAVETLWHTGQA